MPTIVTAGVVVIAFVAVSLDESYRWDSRRQYHLEPSRVIVTS